MSVWERMCLARVDVLLHRLWHSPRYRRSHKWDRNDVFNRWLEIIIRHYPL